MTPPCTVIAAVVLLSASIAFAVAVVAACVSGLHDSSLACELLSMTHE